MTNVTLTTEQAQQIEEALEDIVRVFKFETGTPVEALAAIRAARAEQQTVSGGLCGGCAKKAADGWALYCVECWEQAEQEPVAIMSPNKANIVGINVPHVNIGTNGWIPLYTAPARTKDLTDDEINELWLTHGQGQMMYIHEKFARAVIAADREKNK